MPKSLQVLFLLIFLAASTAVFMTCGTGDSIMPSSLSYKNLDTSVHYIGMETCAQCHPEQTKTYLETGMGRSFGKAIREKSSARFGENALVYDSIGNFFYHPFWKDESMWILEFRMNGKDTVYSRTEKVDYIIGSGLHTNSHLFSTNGYIHQMPITFYTQKKQWDLPPGFENGYNSRFSRKIGLECMTCHNSLPDFVKGSENKFSTVPNGINCERCHGPGEAHLKEIQAGRITDTAVAIDYSIVNPAKLPIDLQFDLCQRCHLQGNTVLKKGKSFIDFRPGMKLSDVMTVFLPHYENGEQDFIMASHADRLKQSPCFIQSLNKHPKEKLRPYRSSLTCVTCHNPHVSVKVTPKEKFKNACLGCHGSPGKTSCSEDNAKRNEAEDNCVHCHMPKSGAIDIPHVSITDHYIRKPEKGSSSDKVKRFIGLMAINDANPDSITRAEAYLNQFEKFEHDPILLDSAFRYLTKGNNEHLPYLIHYYFLKKDYTGVISLPLASISQTSGDAWSFYRIGEAFSSLDNPAEAVKYYRKASTLEPFNLDFQNKLASNLLLLGQLKEAFQIYDYLLKEDPQYAQAWCNIGFIYLQNKDVENAGRCYDRALQLDPDYVQALLNKAGLMLYLKNTKEALRYTGRALEIDPSNIQAKAIKMRFAN